MKRKSLITVLVGAALAMPTSFVAAQAAPEMMMGQMKAQNQDMAELMQKLMQSMTAIQGEKDSTALKSKLAEHAALLDQMRSKRMQQGDMMQKMSGMKKAEPAAKPQAAPDAADHSAHHPAEPAK